MSTTEQEMNEELDAIEAQHAGADEVTTDQAILDEAEQESEQETQTDHGPKEKPPGFMDYNQWVEAGKDPADFKGENAYNAEYDRIQEIRDLKDTMNHVVDGMETWKQQQNEQKAEEIQQAKEEAVRELAQAKEDEDMDAALLAQDKINKLDKQPKSLPVNPVINDFARKTPIIDPQNTQYDAEFHQDMIMIHNSTLDKMLGGDRSRAGELTQAQIERVQTLAYNQAKELHPGKFVSPKNTRKTPASPQRRPAQNKGDTGTKLKTVSGNTKNPRDTSPANDIYEILKERDPKIAETFAKNVIGEQ